VKCIVTRDEMAYTGNENCGVKSMLNFKTRLIFVRPCIIDTNNIENQLDATIAVY
jgi:hypothetical protein